jgi:methylated-DNA-protein-cysteine methyltransferase related protein
MVMQLGPAASSFFCACFICLSVCSKTFAGSNTQLGQVLLSADYKVLTMGTELGKEVPKMSWASVYQFVKQIPRGRVITYGALAKALRLPGGARTAGRAMAGTPSGKGIPWHRVVGDRGKLLIREPYASLQRKLLESEGVRLLESRVDLKAYLWPSPKSRKASQTPQKKHRSQGQRVS